MYFNHKFSLKIFDQYDHYAACWVTLSTKTRAIRLPAWDIFSLFIKFGGPPKSGGEGGGGGGGG